MVEYLWDTRSMKDLKLQAVEVAASFTFSTIILILIAGLLYIAYIIYRKKKDEQKRRLLRVYLQMKLELEQQIRNLHALADNIDKVHKEGTISQVVAKSTSAVSGVLTIVRLFTRQEEKPLGGTAPAMSKEERITSAVIAGFQLLLDVVTLVEDSKHLFEGAKTQSAAELRQKVQNLEQKLQELIQFIDRLTQ